MTLQPAQIGEFICRGRTNIVGGVVSYGLGALFLLFGTLLGVGTAPMLFEDLPMAKQGGIIGVVLGAMMVLFGSLLIYSHRKKQHVVSVDFYTRGVELIGGTGREQWRYEDLPCIAVAVIEPQPRTVVNVLMHLIHAALGLILLKSYSDGTTISTSEMIFGGGKVKFTTDPGNEIAIANISLKNAIEMSAAVARVRSAEDVRRYAA